MHQRLVVTVFVAFGKLQVAVQKQFVPAAPGGYHDALVGRGFGKDDTVLVKMVFGQRGDLPGTGKTGRQRCQRQRASHGVRLQVPQFMPEQPQRPHGHRRIHQAEQHAGADQPKLRHQHQRKRQRHGQRAQVVKRQHLRHQLFQRHIAPQNPHDQRNLQPDQRAHGQHQRIQQEAERAGHVGIGDKQDGRQRTADQRHQQFDAQKMRRQLALEKP